MNLRNETTDRAQIKVNPFVIIGGALIAALLLQWLLPLPFLAPTLARIVGVLVFLLGFGFGLPAARRMRQVKTTFNPYHSSTSLVTSGTFRITRNPLYVANLVNYTGLVIFFRTPWGLLLLPVIVWLMNRWVIIQEERYLEQKFGDEYRHYKAKVRRWL
jgi:protein-S-isoprenylcysteine O-methyltransferase Ste14